MANQLTYEGVQVVVYRPSLDHPGSSALFGVCQLKAAHFYYTCRHDDLLLTPDGSGGAALIKKSDCVDETLVVIHNKPDIADDRTAQAALIPFKELNNRDNYSFGGYIHIRNIRDGQVRVSSHAYGSFFEDNFTAWKLDENGYWKKTVVYTGGGWGVFNLEAGEEWLFFGGTPDHRPGADDFDCPEFSGNAYFEIGPDTYSKNTNFANAFEDSTRFDGTGLEHLSIEGCKFMQNMFKGCTNFDYDISGWDTSNVVNMTNMFFDAQAFNQDLTGWCVTNIDSEPDNFSRGSSMPSDGSKDPCWGHCPRGENGTVDPCP